MPSKKKKKHDVSFMHGLDTVFFFFLLLWNVILFHKLYFNFLQLGTGMVHTFLMF